MCAFAYVRVNGVCVCVHAFVCVCACMAQPSGPFGTAANPVQVESIFNERIMGCPGDCAGGDTRANNEVRCVCLSGVFVCWPLTDGAMRRNTCEAPLRRNACEHACQAAVRRNMRRTL
jgi:hypothetical protein